VTRPEDVILAEIQAAFSTTAFGRPNRLWRNAVADCYVGKLISGKVGGTITIAHSRMIHAGLPEGSADLIGFTWEGRILSIEVKRPGQRPRPDQRKWRDMVLDFNGLAGTAHNVEEAGLIISGDRRD